MFTTMKKCTLTLALLMIVYAPSHASSAASSIPAKTKAQHVWGTLYTVGNMKYLGEDPKDLLYNQCLQNILDENNQPIPLKSSDVVVDVWASSDESENWNCHGHPILDPGAFPSALPISMLEGKKEDEPLIFKLRSPETKKLFNILLLCKGRNGEPLPERLERLKQHFAGRPNFNCSDEARLLAEGILIQNSVHKEIENLKAQIRSLPSLLWEQEDEVAEFCKKKYELERALYMKKKAWTDVHGPCAWGVPEFMHGPNGFKLISSSTQLVDDSASSTDTK